MPKPFRLETLPKNPEQQLLLYRAARSIFTKRYGKIEGHLAFAHAKAVTEEVIRYTARSKDAHWAGMCIVLAILHPLDARTVLPPAVLRHLSEADQNAIRRSFLNLNMLRVQDEAPPDAKEPSIYNVLLKPYQSKAGYVVVPPEVFVRTIDMSEPQFFRGRSAHTLHNMMSHGKFPDVIRNMAHSMLDYWRPAAVQLLLFSCYDRQSDVIATYLYPKVFVKMRQLFQSLEDEISKLRVNFSKYLSNTMACAENRNLPIVTKTNRETGEQVPFILREKTSGSATIKAVSKGLVSPDGTDFDPTLILEGIHDVVASTLVAKRCYHAEALYHLITTKHSHLLVDTEHLFYPQCRDPEARSCSGYSGVGHLDFRANLFGADRIRRVELHIRSLDSDREYYHGNAGRGFRDSAVLADAWGDLNFKIVQALGNHH
ncbi:hypothetical protein KKB44_04120 [Candidatus Micrarchaeota archaeon]|nr:hypothetical protein [Candidatus Micrarchaeota archaeon]